MKLFTALCIRLLQQMIGSDLDRTTDSRRRGAKRGIKKYIPKNIKNKEYLRFLLFRKK